MYELISKKCPNCGAPVPIHHPKHTYSFTCPTCGSPVTWISEHDANDSRLEIINAIHDTEKRITPQNTAKILKEEHKERTELLEWIIIIIIPIVVGYALYKFFMF